MTRLRQALEYGFYLLVKGLARALPHAAVRSLGVPAGAVAHLIDRRHRRTALANLELAFPTLGEAERRRLVRSCYRHFGGLLFDSLSLERFDGAAICRRVRFDGWERLAEAEARGRGLLLLTAHFGSFELLSHFLALFHGPVLIVMRPSDNPLLDGALRRSRERLGCRTVSKRRAARAMARELRGGGRTIILIDHRVPRPEGIDVPFFGRPAITSTLPARLSLRHGAPVVPLFVYPRPGGRYLVAARPPIEPSGDGPEAIERLTRLYSDAIEREIRGAPEQWWWLHDRWKRT